MSGCSIQSCTGSRSCVSPSESGATTKSSSPRRTRRRLRIACRGPRASGAAAAASSARSLAADDAIAGREDDCRRRTSARAAARNAESSRRPSTSEPSVKPACTSGYTATSRVAGVGAQHGEAAACRRGARGSSARATAPSDGRLVPRGTVTPLDRRRRRRRGRSRRSRAAGRRRRCAAASRSSSSIVLTRSVRAPSRPRSSRRDRC